MSPLRRLLFWLHLVIGIAAGGIVLVMCLSGVALTYEKQLVEWADATAMPDQPGGTGRVGPEAMLAAAASAVGARPLVLTIHPRGPATVAFEGGRAVLVDPGTGRVLGDSAPRLRRAFRAITAWHRWLGQEGPWRATGRWLTGVANLGFLALVLSGLYLWLPAAFTTAQFRQVTWFRRGLSPKARDFNWHNVVGLWSAIPLAIVVAGAVPISFGWAGTLVFRLAGEAPPAPAGGRGERRPASDADPNLAETIRGVDVAVAAATSAVRGWRTATARLSSRAEPLTVSVDEGLAGQPQYRTTFLVDRDRGRIVRREGFEDLGPGRQWRTWLRFVHTGEYYGIAGQTLAGAVSAGGAVLVYTGVALAWRRFVAWRRRRAVITTRTAAA